MSTEHADGPLPSSPTRGEVPVVERFASASTLFTSPLVGEAGRGPSRLVLFVQRP
jgi:hypothetical protein